MKRKLFWAGIVVCCAGLFPAWKALSAAYPDVLRLRTMNHFERRLFPVLQAVPARPDPELSDLKRQLGKPDMDDAKFAAGHLLAYQCMNGFVVVVVLDSSHPDESLVYEVKGGIIRHGVPIGVLVVNRARVAWQLAIAAALLLLGAGMIYVAAFRRQRRNSPPEMGIA